MPQRRLSAILAADVVGFSAMMGEDETGTLAALKAFRREIFNPVIEDHGGRVVKLMGDGTLVEFQSVVDAVNAAISVQERINGAGGGAAPATDPQSPAADAREAEAPSASAIKIRIGVNIGDIIVDGDDIYGDGVNVAARLEALAEADDVLISGAVHDSIRKRVSAPFEDFGAHTLKHIAEPVQVYRWSPAIALASKALREREVGAGARSGPAASPPTPVAPASGVNGARFLRMIGGAVLVLAIVLAALFWFRSGEDAPARRADDTAVQPAATNQPDVPPAATTTQADASLAAEVEGAQQTDASDVSPRATTEDLSAPKAEAEPVSIVPEPAATSEASPTSGSEAQPATLPETGLETVPDVKPQSGSDIDAQTSPVAEPAPTGDALRDFLVGSTLRGGRDFGGSTFSVALREGGRLRGRVSVGDSFGSSSIDSGRWAVNGSRLCLAFDTLAQGVRRCAQVGGTTTALTFERADGAPRGWSVQARDAANAPDASDTGDLAADPVPGAAAE